jgi:NADH-quinone oxidoreductase subunit M
MNFLYSIYFWYFLKSILVFLVYIILTYKNNNTNLLVKINLLYTYIVVILFLFVYYSTYIETIIDYYALIFSVITILIIFLCIKYTEYFFLEVYAGMCFCLIILLYFFLEMLWSRNLVSFFIFLELTVLPLFFLIIYYGKRERRVYASFVLSFYSIFASLCVFFSLNLIMKVSGTTNYYKILNFFFVYPECMYFELKTLCFFVLMLGFCIKLPVFSAHIWLPEAHVEASTVGSVILSSLILKIPVFGICTIVLPLFSDMMALYHMVFLYIFGFSSIYISYIILYMIDAKKIVAYFSILHMNLGSIGLCMDDYISFFGSIYACIAHCFTAAFLFFLIGFLYDVYGIRNLLYFGSLFLYYPILSAFFLISILSNMSFPGTFNFVGEFLILYALLNKLPNLYVIFLFIFLSSLFVNFFFFCRIFFFVPNKYDSVYKLLELPGVDINNLYKILSVLTFFIILGGFFPSTFFDTAFFLTLKYV